MSITYLLLGSNIGDRLSYLRQACLNINKRIGNITKESSVYETASWGYDDNAYLNMVVECMTDQSPRVLLETIHEIEAELGRVRLGNGYAARTIDIDILFFNSDVVNEPDLQIPHRLLQERRFVLTPLSEIAPDFYHPVLHLTISQLLTTCTDKCAVKLYKIER